MTSSDPNERLRAPRSIPDDELCICSHSPSIVICSVLRENPIACLDCNLEVAPDQIGFPQGLRDALASWRALHDPIYIRWLHASDLDDSAKQELESPTSRVNKLGLHLASELSNYRKCYYWWFVPSDEEGSSGHCLHCGGELQRAPRGYLCEPCRIFYEA